MTTIFLVHAENPYCPPIVVLAFTSREAAVREAVVMTNLILADADRPQNATPETYEQLIEDLQEEEGAQHCYVEVSEVELQS